MKTAFTCLGDKDWLSLSIDDDNTIELDIPRADSTSWMTAAEARLIANHLLELADKLDPPNCLGPKTFKPDGSGWLDADSQRAAAFKPTHYMQVISTRKPCMVGGEWVICGDGSGASLQFWRAMGASPVPLEGK